MTQRPLFAAVLAILLSFPAALTGGAVAAELPEQAAARQIYEATGIQGGLVVHLGCGDGRLTAALRTGEGFLVQGLDADAGKVENAREHIRSLGLYGPVSAQRWSGERLPYVDNSVNLIVAEEPAAVPAGELMRVLAPLGVAYVKKGDQWTKTVKPRPKEIDQWTHFLHGADNNAVAADTVIDSPQHIQWIGDPGHSRSHQFLTSISAMVSAQGRLFYIVDEGSSWLHEYLPAQWSLCARDAFNGVLLWRRPIPVWQPAGQRGRIPFPPDLFRRLVAVDDRVYTTRGIFGPVIALSAASGETVRTYAGTEKTEELICDKNVLYCVAAVADPDKIDRREATYQRTQPAKQRIMAVRADTGEVLWSKEDADTTGYMPLTLIAQGGRALFQNTQAVLCLDARTGRPQWRHEQPSAYAREAWSTPTLVIAGDVVLSADRTLEGSKKKTKSKSSGSASGNARLVALAADSGKELWHCDCAEGHTSSPEVMVANGLVWVGQNRAHKELDFRTGRDLHTGEVRKQFSSSDDGWATWHHHRCYREKATTRYLLTSRTGVEFTDLESGQLTPHHWIRGVCRYGVLPCNGLLYLPPDQCACYIESKLCGFNVLAPRSSALPLPREVTDPGRLERGPAYSLIPNSQSLIPSSEDWPTYRHDAARSGQASTPLVPELKPLWSTPVGDKLTSLVSAAGKLYLADVDAHAVICLDAETGKVAWRFTAGGRVDSPPTIARGVAVFGSRDGCVYALRAGDGKLVWRFQAAPDNRQLVAHGQLESVWPVHGSTLVDGDAVYLTAGRNSYFDEGMCLYKLDLGSGKTLQAKRCYSRDEQSGKRFDLFPPFKGNVLPDREMPGLLPDVFSEDKNGFYLRSVALNGDLKPLGRGSPHLFSSMGLLDDASWERTYWLYGTHMYGGARGWGVAKGLEPAGRILTFDDTSVYAFQDATFPKAGLCAADKVPEHVKSPIVNKKARKKAKHEDQEHKRPKTHGDKSSGGADEDDLDEGKLGATFAYRWRSDVPLNVRALVLSGKVLFAAGPPRFDERAAYAYLNNCPTDKSPPPPLLADAEASIEGKKGSLLWAVDKNDGKKLAVCKLDSAPVFDGMIAAHGRIYLSMLGGQVICLGP